MRPLDPPPSTFLDGRALRSGSFCGALPPVDYSPVAGALTRLARHKRWVFAAIATDDVWVAFAIVRLGYVANLFAYAVDLRTGALLSDRAALAPPLACAVGDRAGEGCAARFSMPRAAASFTRAVGASSYALRVRLGALRLDARLETAGAPPPLAVLGPVPGGIGSATEKRALLGASGELRVGSRRFRLDGGLGGFDYTNGLLARRTAWRWAYALGRAKSGERVAVNLTSGFVGDPECAVWVDGALHGTSPATFAFDAARPMTAPWSVATTGGEVDLRFTPMAGHRDATNLGFLKASFVQPAGRFDGTLRVEGRTLALDGVAGVTEDQDSLW